MWVIKSLKINNIISFKEQTFQFRNGKAVVIVGSNLDDSSQKGNGSGKSSLIESIALAFTGSSIRDVKTKELINNDSDFGEVLLTLENNVTGKELRIWRKIYANTKSGEYAAYINGIEQSDRYSDANMFNSYIWETIGISKEDFFSFFLITRDNYTPFLNVSDTKKKEIINRFSGADRVDAVFDEIAKDSLAVQNKVAELERDLLQNTTKQEVLAEQILAEEELVSEEAINIQLSELDLELTNKGLLTIDFENEVFKAKSLLADAQKKFGEFDKEALLLPFKENLEIAELEYETFEFSKNFDAVLDKIQDEKDILEVDIFELKKKQGEVRKQFVEEIEKITLDELELTQSIAGSEKELRENEKFESEVTKSLHDSIECPKCHHHFSLRDESFNYDEAKAKLPIIQQDIKEYKEIIEIQKKELDVDIAARKLAVNQKIIAGQEEIKNQIQDKNNQLVELADKKTKVNSEYQLELQEQNKLLDSKLDAKRSLDSQIKQVDLLEKNLIADMQNEDKALKLTEKNLQDHLDAIEALNQKILDIHNNDVDRSRIDNLTKQVDDLVKVEKIISTKLEAKRKEKESIDSWDINFKNFKSHLANKSIKNIQDYTNLFLESMGSNLAINIDGYKTLANKKIKEQISTSVMRDGFEAGSYGKFSGGERGRIDICAIMAMQELIQLNSSTGGIDLLICDEILDQVDSAGLEAIITSLQDTQKTIMLVSQNDINTLAEYAITIEKKNKVSTILN